MGDDAEQIAPADEAPELTEQRFAANLRAAREAVSMSQERLAEEMAARGWPWHQQTVTRVENGRRMVRLGEAKSVAEILEMSLDQLTWPTSDARIVERLAEWMRVAKTSYRRIAEETAELLRTTGLLSIDPAVADSFDSAAAARIRDAITEARAVQKLTPEGAVAQGIALKAAHASWLEDRGLEVPTFQPQSVADIVEVADTLRTGEVVIIDLTRTPIPEVQRIKDFVDGATRVRGGVVEHIGGMKYRATPATTNYLDWAISETRGTLADAAPRAVSGEPTEADSP